MCSTVRSVPLVCLTNSSYLRHIDRAIIALDFGKTEGNHFIFCSVKTTRMLLFLTQKKKKKGEVFPLGHFESE